MEKEYKKIISFLKNYQTHTNARGYVLGISGGKDSTIVAKLLVDPLQWLQEYRQLGTLGCDVPLQYFDPYVQITTPFDVMLNSERNLGGTVGKGIWETICREREGMSLYIKDLSFPQVVKMKLKLIREWAEEKIQFDETYHRFRHVFDNLDSLVDTYCKTFYSNVLLGEPYGFRSSNTSIIFEGSQGVLLDPDVGLSHKYTTPITCCPSPDILPSFITKDQITINFVYRSYLTRHGKGPVGDSVFKEIQNPYETNRNNLFQGEFWTYEFNEELVLYGINHVQSKFKGWYPTRAIETCCDICEGHTLATLCSYSVKTYKHNFSSICK